MADLKITQLDAVVTPVDADLFESVQSVATTPVNKKITWTVIKAFLKTYFDTLYDALGAASAVAGDLATHEGDTANPHEVTAAQVGAAPDASPTFTGLVTTPAIKITTGAGASKVLTSDADGDATWETPSGGGPVYKTGLAPKYSIASETQTIAHGLGVVPKMVRMTAAAVNHSLSWGTFDATTACCLSVVGSDGGMLATSAKILAVFGPGVAWQTIASVAVDATNITLTWVGSGTYENWIRIMWEAEG